LGGHPALKMHVFFVAVYHHTIQISTYNSRKLFQS